MLCIMDMFYYFECQSIPPIWTEKVGNVFLWYGKLIMPGSFKAMWKVLTNLDECSLSIGLDVFKFNFY